MAAVADVGAAPKSIPRDIAFDILKGIGIVEVLIHHTFNFSARKFTEFHSAEWWTLMVSNRILHFAIPTFLLISSLLLARSLAKPNVHYGRYVKRRFVRSAAPYIVWTGLYLVFRVSILKLPTDLLPTTVIFPWGGELTGPRVLIDPAELRHYFTWGKGYFHLYFLSVLLQISIILPFVVWTMKRVRLSFGGVALAAGALQLGVYLLQAKVLRSPHPASMAIWYLPSILIGAWLGMNWPHWPEIWRRGKLLLASSALLGGAVYVYLSVEGLRGGRIPNLAYISAFTLYGTSVALFLLGLCGQIRRVGRHVAALAAVGSLSLPIFVLHPMILHFFGGPRISGFLGSIPFVSFGVWLLLLGITYGVVHVLILLRTDRVLFGRDFRREPKTTRGRDASPMPERSLAGNGEVPSPEPTETRA